MASDFYLNVGVLRHEMASALSDNIEDAAYVLGDFAQRTQPGTADFDDLCDQIDALDQEGRAALLSFCRRISDRLHPQE